MADVQIDVDSLAALLEHAKRVGTLEQWADVALDWA